MDLLDGLVAYWKLDETSGAGVRADAHSDNDLTPVGTAASTTGKILTAAYFDGTAGTSLQCADNAALSLGNSSFTVAGWFLLDSVTTNAMMVGKYGTAPNEWLLWMYSNGSIFAWTHWNTTEPPSDLFWGTAVTPGVWYFVVAWVDIDNHVIGLQVNDETPLTEAFTQTPLDTTTAFRIGASNTGTDAMNGRIDELGIWKRALTAEERTALCNYGFGRPYPLNFLLIGGDMVTVQRRNLRVNLGTQRLRQTVAGTTTFSPNLGAGSLFTVLDRTLALPDFSGEELYQRAWARVGTANLASSRDYYVGSLNVGSGAFVGLGAIIDPVQSGAVFEIHEKVSPAEMDAALDETIATLRVRQEVAMNTVEGANFYQLDLAAFPHRIMGGPLTPVYYYADPSSSSNRSRHEIDQHHVVTTATGTELRLPGALGASQQIAFEALLQVTLGAGDAATVNLPDEETVLWGAAARCYDLLTQRSPAQEATIFAQRRKEAAMMFSRLAQRHFPEITRPIGFSQSWESRSYESLE